MKKALILHCWFGKPTDNWYPWLKTELVNKGYVVEVPEIPTMGTDKPDLDTQIKFLKNMNFADENTMIVGHSLGSLLAMRLAELQKVKGLILTSGWDFNDLTKEHESYWRNPYNHKLIKENAKKIIVIHSDNDPYITAFQAEEMAKRLGAEFILIKGAGHFLEKDGVTKITEILNCI